MTKRAASTGLYLGFPDKLSSLLLSSAFGRSSKKWKSIRRKDLPVMVFCFLILMTFDVESIIMIRVDSFITFL